MITQAERTALEVLIEFARVSLSAFDDSCVNGQDPKAPSEVSHEDMEKVERAVEALMALPDDRPGFTLGDVAKAEWALRRLLADPVPMPEARTKAVALYVPPFRYDARGGYIWDSANEMVADRSGESPEKAARIRGWGRICYMPEAEALQDEAGRMIADAMNAYYSANLQSS